MKYLLPAFFILLSGNLLAQNLTNIDRENQILRNKETFEVLKSDTSIKQGSYKKYRWSKLVTEGYYKNNKRDSVWIEYGYGGKASAKGLYKDGKRTGIWEYYDWKGNLTDKYDMNTNARVFHKPDPLKDTSKIAVITGKNTIYTLLDYPPVYAPGEVRISMLMAYTIRYPARAKENNTMGKALIAVTIDENGHASNYHIKKNIKDGIGEEALRVVSMLDDDWIPGVLNGKPVKSEYIIPVNFSMSNK